MEGLKVALVHEWLVSWGGSESVLSSLARLFPDAPILTAVYKPDERIESTFAGREIRPSALQILPGIRHHYRSTLPLMPWAFSRMDLSGFDLVVSSSHAFAKSIRVDPGAVHVCYCHTPPRYLWDLYEAYNSGFLGEARKPLMKYLRRVDARAATRVHSFVANSYYVADRISRSYGRQSSVIYPPVDVRQFNLEEGDRTHYLAGGRMVQYKKLDRAIEAANRQGFPLVVFGDGPERDRLARISGPSVKLIGSVSQAQLAELIRHSRAFLFPGVEDFGILPVEAQAGGLPVIALAKGGALETVRPDETGLLYEDDSVEGLVDAVLRFENETFDPETCRKNALRFSRERFEEEIAEAVSGVFPRK